MEERREGYAEIKNELAHIKGYLISEFGGIDALGNKSEGNLNVKLRLIDQKLTDQNSSVAKIQHQFYELPCEAEKANAGWVKQNIIGLWCVVGAVGLAILADWIRIWYK